MAELPSDERTARQILDIFLARKVGAGGILRRNDFFDVRDADFQRGMNKAMEKGWIKKTRDRYTYVLSEIGLAECKTRL